MELPALQGRGKWLLSAPQQGGCFCIWGGEERQLPTLAPWGLFPLVGKFFAWLSALGLPSFPWLTGFDGQNAGDALKVGLLAVGCLPLRIHRAGKQAGQGTVIDAHLAFLEEPQACGRSCHCPSAGHLALMINGLGSQEMATWGGEAAYIDNVASCRALQTWHLVAGESHGCWD